MQGQGILFHSLYPTVMGVEDLSDLLGAVPDFLWHDELS